MKLRYWLFVFLVGISCTKDPLSHGAQSNSTNVLLKDFTLYTIPKDSNYADKSTYKVFLHDSLHFIVWFDSTAIYTTKDPVNQYDINKLYGFSDNQTFHQLYSARYGWRWSDDSLRLFGYCYNNAVRSFVELCTVHINEFDTCTISIHNGFYVFTVNGLQKGKIPRTATIGKPYGYQLYPYFGGNETAPHTVEIYIKELN